MDAKQDKLRKALKPFAALLQPHNDKGDGSLPVFGINDAKITVGDLRRARSALAQSKEQP